MQHRQSIVRTTRRHPSAHDPVPSDGRTTLLLTGFGPFPSVSVNATMMLVPRLAKAARRLFPAVHIVTEILPTEWVAAPARVEHLLRIYRPDIVLHFGVSSRARGFEIESRGRNQCAMVPDASGCRPVTSAVVGGGMDLLPSRVPVAAIVRRLQLQSIPAYRSWSAGTYLCNATLYHVLTQTTGQACEAGFVHIPDKLAGSAALAYARSELRTRPGCPLTWPQALAGGLEIIATLLDQPTPNPARRTAALRDGK